MPRDFAGVLVEQRAHIRDRCGLLLQQNLPSDRLDLGVRQRDADREAVEQVCQKLNFGQRTLTGRHDHDVAVELLGNRFGDLCQEATARCWESPMYCWASSRMSSVQGRRPFPALSSASFATRRNCSVVMSEG